MFLFDLIFQVFSQLGAEPWAKSILAMTGSMENLCADVLEGALGEKSSA